MFAHRLKVMSDSTFETINVELLAQIDALGSDVEQVQIEQRADDLIVADSELIAALISMREKHGLSQGAVAARMGVSQPTVSKFERYDTNPRLSTIRRYALAVNASVEHWVSDVCAHHAADEFDAIVKTSFGSGGPMWIQPKVVRWGSSVTQLGS